MSSAEDFSIELILQLQRQDPKAQELCYRKMSSLLYSTIYRICQSHAIAEELLQDTFVDIFGAVVRYQPSGSFMGWCKRIAYNNTLNWVNRQKKKESGDVSDLDAIIGADNISDDVESSNMFETLLNKLNPQARLVVWLFFVEGYSHKEIAETVGKTESFSKSIVSRSLQKLRPFVEDGGYASI